MKIEKIEKTVAELHDKEECVTQIRNLKQALKKKQKKAKKVHKVIKFNQKACLKSYIDMNTELKKKKCKK